MSTFRLSELMASLSFASDLVMGQPMEDALRVGPFAALSLGQYTSDSYDCQPDNPVCPTGNSIEGAALHGWISIGVRGAYTP